MSVRVAVDAMGGDHAPAAVIEGAVEAAREVEEGVELLLIGPEDHLRELLARHDGAGSLPLRIVHAPEVIGMAEAPGAAVKTKRRSSIHVGLGACAEGQADAFVSAGNTGAVMGASLFVLGRLPGVARPSVAGPYPTTEGGCLLLDAGTNVDCKPEHLLQFARMGAAYAERLMDRDRPRIGLMNIGEEPGKGNEQVREAFSLLSEAGDLNFVGNIEGRDLLFHAADVVITDGFVGNVLLKLGESLATALGPLFRQEMERQGLTEEQQRLVGGVLKGVLRPFDYHEQGGAPLLGVQGNVFIGHGSSPVKAIRHMILMAVRAAQQQMAAHVAEALAPAETA